MSTLTFGLPTRCMYLPTHSGVRIINGLTDNNKKPVSFTVNKNKQLHNKYSKLSMKRLYVEKIKSNCVFELEFGGNCSGWCWSIVHTCSSLDNEHLASVAT